MAESSHRSNGNSSQRKHYSRGNGNLKAPSKEDDEPPPQRDYYPFELGGDPRYNPISRSEEMMYAEMASKGDEFAINRLIESNLRFVIKVAGEYLGQGLPLIDLVSAGYEGLIDSVRGGFDYRLGFRVITYARKGIRQRIERELRERRNGSSLSLDTILGGTPLGQIPSPDPTPSDDVERDETSLLLEKALATLYTDDRRVLDLLYYEEFNEREIAERMGVSPRRINQRKTRALEKLRKIFLYKKEQIF